ncbi:MAG: hypothetical protein QNJ05_01475 [Woeseiaceae bacterium]|nr:hypothetical protein [Woeseiaceae bacterium]
MTEHTRRNILHAGIALTIPPAVATLITGCQPSDNNALPLDEVDAGEPNIASRDSIPTTQGDPMKIHYLEIVTPEADALCDQYSAVHGITFGDPDANLGGARTATMAGGGMLGIRGPMRESEMPVVRPYALVDDISAAVDSAVKAGAELALPPMELPGHGTCAIVIHGGIDCGFWQV